MTETPPAYDPAAARLAIEADAQRRAQAAAAEYDALVDELQKRHNCLVVYQPQITPDGRVTARAVIAPQQ